MEGELLRAIEVSLRCLIPLAIGPLIYYTASFLLTVIPRAFEVLTLWILRFLTAIAPKEPQVQPKLLAAPRTCVCGSPLTDQAIFCDECGRSIPAEGATIRFTSTP